MLALKALVWVASTSSPPQPPTTAKPPTSKNGSAVNQPPSIEKINYLMDLETAGLPVPDDLNQYKLEAYDRWKNGLSLGDAFRITDNSTERKIRRNVPLKQYASLIHGSKNHKCITIAEEVKKIRQQSRDVSEVLKAIDKINRLPGSKRQIHRILFDI